MDSSVARKLAGAAAATILVAMSGCAPVSKGPLDVVENVDLSRYVGKWYEIASYPAPFQQGCVGTTAEYAVRDDGRISVINGCYQGSFEGKLERIEGSARVVDTETNARLKVSFFPPFEGDYQIIELDPEYRWAVVGEPSRTFLWILSRTPTMDAAVYDSIIESLPDKGYDPALLNLTPQPPENP